MTQESRIDPTLESLKDRCWREIAAIDQALDEGRIDEVGWHTAMALLIKPAYLAGENPYVQAGHSGNGESWEASRGFIAEALHRTGTFLDVGCASGVLMESAQRWGARKGLRIEPYGLDIVPEFVELARRRLPHWADRIHVGNIRSWEPDNERFDIVLIRPEYAPAARRVEMIQHVIHRILKPDGRLIVVVGNEEVALRSVESGLTRRGVRIHGRAEVPHPKDDRLSRRLFWIDVSVG